MSTIEHLRDDKVVLGLISNKDDTAYMEMKNILVLGQLPSTERLEDQGDTGSIFNRATVEWVLSYMYLGVHISSDLTWTGYFRTQPQDSPPVMTFSTLVICVFKLSV